MSKKLKALIAILLVMTCVIAVIHIRNQEDISCMEIHYADQIIKINFEDLNKIEFSGELVNGKGDVSYHTYTGISIKNLLLEKGIDVSKISTLTVTSADNYSVEFTHDEILAENKVFAAIVADGKTIEGIDSGSNGVQIVVFGDANSKRCVRFATKITLY